MRLAQLARKISVRPAEIAQFLQSGGDTISDEVNSRLTDGQIERVLFQFVPKRAHEILEEINKPVVEEIASIENTIETSNPPMLIEEVIAEPTFTEPVRSNVIESATQNASESISEVTLANEHTNEPENENKNPFDGIEVIKAPKVTLSGLKVVGKIELPESKKKEPEVSVTFETEGEQQVAPQPEEIKPKPQFREKRERNTSRSRREQERPRKNPIAVQREREAREAADRKREELQREKERRTQYYNSRIKQGAPKKAARLVDEPLESIHDIKPEPTTVLGKLWRWLTT